MNPEALKAKKALFTRLTALTAAELGNALADVQVTYAWPGEPQDDCIYGGGVRFTRVSAGHDGYRELWLETATVGVYIRAKRSGVDAEASDARATELGAALEELLAEQPELSEGFSYTGIFAGQADYALDNEWATTVLAYQVQIQYYLD